MKMKKLPSEANSEQGDLSGEGAGAKRRQPASGAMLATLGENRELMDKNRIEPERSGDSLPA